MDLINNSQKFNLLNITGVSQLRDNRLKVPVSKAGRDVIVKMFDLKSHPTPPAPSRLTIALQTLVNQSGVLKDDGSELFDSLKELSAEGDVLKVIGAHIMQKQVVTGGDVATQLSFEEKTLLQNLEIVMKSARKLNDDSTSSITFDCFKQFERRDRYAYKDGAYQVPRQRDKGTPDTTAWTSYFKDALAFDMITFSSPNNVANAMKSVGAIIK